MRAASVVRFNAGGLHIGLIIFVYFYFRYLHADCINM